MCSNLSVRHHATDTITIIIINIIKEPPYLDKLQLEVLGHVVVLAHPEDDGDDVLGRVTQAPQVSHHLVRFIDAAVDAVLQHVFDQNWVGLVTHLHIQPGSLLMTHRGWEFAHY